MIQICHFVVCAIFELDIRDVLVSNSVLCINGNVVSKWALFNVSGAFIAKINIAIEIAAKIVYICQMILMNMANVLFYL